MICVTSKGFPPSDQSNFYFQKRSRKLRDTPKSLKSAAFGFLWKVQIYIFLNLTLHIKSLKYFFEVSFQKIYLSLMEEKITFAFISLTLTLFNSSYSNVLVQSNDPTILQSWLEFFLPTNLISQQLWHLNQWKSFQHRLKRTKTRHILQLPKCM